MKRRDERNALLAGFVALSLTAMAALVIFTGHPSFSSDYRIEAVFESAATEIAPRAPVRIAGVDVGEVTDVRRGPGGTAVVEMTVSDGGRPLHRDATMRLRPRLFLEGNFFVDVQPGSPSAPELEDGATLPLAQTAVAVQADEVFRVFTGSARTATRDVLRELAAATGRGGARSLRRAFRESGGALLGTAVVAESLRGSRDDDLSAFVAAQARISDRLAERRGQLARLIGSFRTTMDALAGSREELGATIREADEVLAAAPPALDAIDSALPPLRELAGELRPALRAAPPVLDRARPFVRTLAALLAPQELPALARDLGPAASELAGLSAELGPLFDLVHPVSRCVRDNFVPVLEMQVPDGPLTTDQPVWQEALRVGPGLSGSQANFDGNGTSTRYGGLAGGQNLIASRHTPGDDLVMLSSLPLLGSRPPYTPGRQPPLRPNEPCERQQVPNLRTETTPPPAQRQVVELPERGSRP